ncbi:conserved protein of unknown function [Bradyrhizobium sp. ORS 285]|uniref:hypothetical protein n=1 Tax=Bradyrhizobium sp. ORS 285 TaxID=115808 RepID=UPI000240A032|nr:hypothetical protein [Bradyrhizobium sp. ORS 285]CCD86983.1 conserved hypothetical protein [Bradyrhizobium sp. ORS 285]SMX62007.1 conserved protein of unknown function [Bradyrhizobium sp. ORS 285]
MNLDDVKSLTEKTLADLLGQYGFDHVDLVPGKDHDDEDALFLTANYRGGSTLPGGDVLVGALTALRTTLQKSGESRFPYLTHHVEGEEEYEEEETGE